MSAQQVLVVLAAGRGSRLGAIGAPKWLLPLDGVPLATRQLSAFPDKVLDNFTERLVVAGYASYQVEAFVSTLAEPFHILFNEQWETRNNWYSLLVAFDYLNRQQFSGSVVLLNSDLLFTQAAVAPLFAASPLERGDIELLVDFERELTDEAMTVSCDPADDRRIDRIGKTGVYHPRGEDIGMWRLHLAGWQGLRRELQKFLLRPDCRQHWYQHALDSLIDDRSVGRPIVVRAVPTGSSQWVEIDDPKDLMVATEMLRTTTLETSDVDTTAGNAISLDRAVINLGTPAAHPELNGSDARVTTHG